MLILGIESTCDETSAAIVQNGNTIISHTIASQASIHNAFGGVVPELASRHHIERIIPVINDCAKEIDLSSIDLIAVASEPGLIGSLLVGIQTAKALAWSLDRPLIGINHIEAHLYASMMNCENLLFPALGVVLSGGHTTLLTIHDIGEYELIGQTVDDAIGEAFDKVAKMLNLGYPGGPVVEQMAQSGNPYRFPLKAGKVKEKPYCFSFSGLKTAALYTLQKESSFYSQDLVADMCASFQHAAITDLCKKIQKACDEFQPRAIFLGGGVTQNNALRKALSSYISLPTFWPPSLLCLDNAAMIAGLAYHKWKRNPFDARFTLEPRPRVPFLSKNK